MSHRAYPRVFLATLALLTAALACNMPTSSTPSNGQTTNGVGTAAAQTLEALQTAVAQIPDTFTPGADIPISTAQPGETNPSATPVPQDAAATTAPQGSPSNTPAPSPCDSAGFISDVSIPDGTILPAGTQFTKTWRLRNNGTCTWTADYNVVFISGDAMGAAASQKLGVSVSPGASVDISVVMKAPAQGGEYRGNWQLRNAAGVLFGVGAENQPFYVDVKVASTTPQSGGYNFTTHYCDAEWTGGSTALPCPGKDGSSNGFVLFKDNPYLETGYQDNEPALITNPPYTNGGVIQAKFPAYTVKDGEHFTSIVGCEFKAAGCSVIFGLAYQREDGTVVSLGTWNESYDNAYTKVNVDLSGLAGKTVRFILSVTARGGGEGDRAEWLSPKIK